MITLAVPANNEKRFPVDVAIEDYFGPQYPDHSFATVATGDKLVLHIKFRGQVVNQLEWGDEIAAHWKNWCVDETFAPYWFKFDDSIMYARF